MLKTTLGRWGIASVLALTLSSSLAVNASYAHEISESKTIVVKAPVSGMAGLCADASVGTSLGSAAQQTCTEVAVAAQQDVVLQVTARANTDATAEGSGSASFQINASGLTSDGCVAVDVSSPHNSATVIATASAGGHSETVEASVGAGGTSRVTLCLGVQIS